MLDGKAKVRDFEKLQRKKCGRFLLIFMFFPIFCIVMVPYFLSTIFLD